MSYVCPVHWYEEDSVVLHQHCLMLHQHCVILHQHCLMLHQHCVMLHQHCVGWHGARRHHIPSTGFMNPSCAMLAQAAAMPEGEMRGEGDEGREGWGGGGGGEGEEER